MAVSFACNSCGCDVAAPNDGLFDVSTTFVVYVDPTGVMVIPDDDAISDIDPTRVSIIA